MPKKWSEFTQQTTPKTTDQIVLLDNTEVNPADQNKRMLLPTLLGTPQQIYEKTSNYTVTASDNNVVLVLNKGTEFLLSINSAQSYTTGQYFYVYSIGAGLVAILGVGATTFQPTNINVYNPVQYELMRFYHMGSNVWTIERPQNPIILDFVNTYAQLEGVDQVTGFDTGVNNLISAQKNAAGGIAGIDSSYKIESKNQAGTFTSYLTNTNSASRTYTFQDRNGTIADDTDLALKANLASPNFTGNVTIANSGDLVMQGTLTATDFKVNNQVTYGTTVEANTARFNNFDLPLDNPEDQINFLAAVAFIAPIASDIDATSRTITCDSLIANSLTAEGSNFDLSLKGNGSGNTITSVSRSGGTVKHTIANTSNTASSAAQIVLNVAGASSGDAFTSWGISGGTTYSAGYDTSANKWVLSGSSALGTSDIIRATTSLVQVGAGADSPAEAATIFLVTQNNPTSISVRDSTNDTECIVYAGNGETVMGARSNTKCDLKTNNLTALSLTTAQLVQFAAAGSWVANGTGTVTNSNLAPANTSATISKWLKVLDNTGATYLIQARLQT